MSTYESSSVGSVLKTLILCSEKAATIARQVKLDYSPFESLVQSKSGLEMSGQCLSAVDVKTLADVLIQETIRSDISKVFPDISASIFGEETNCFHTSSAQPVFIRIPDSVEKLNELLSQLLHKQVTAARPLAETILRPLFSFHTHTAVQPCLSELDAIAASSENNSLAGLLVLSACGVWIDPIDATAAYVEGTLAEPMNITTSTKVDKSNLSPCVAQSIPLSLANPTVLIGLFDKITGMPLLGIINQPFWLPPNTVSTDSLSRQLGRIFWGSYVLEPTLSSIFATCALSPASAPDQLNLASFPDHIWNFVRSQLCLHEPSFKNVVRVAGSSSDSERLTKAFATWNSDTEQIPRIVLLFSPGAGFKSICLFLDQMDAYLLLGPSTYFWDTCAPHAILRAMGGGIVRLALALQAIRQLICASPATNLDAIKAQIRLQLPEWQIVYETGISGFDMNVCCNTDGFLAYRRPQVASKLLLHLAQFLD